MMWKYELIVLVTLFACYYAWHIPDAKQRNVQRKDFRRGFLACHCSPSRSGASVETLNDIGRTLTWLHSNYTKLQHEVGMNETQARKTLTKMANSLIHDCFNRTGYQNCINADAIYRRQQRMSICSYDANSSRNVARIDNGNWVTEGRCPIRQIDLKPNYLLINSSMDRVGYFWCWCSPGGKMVGGNLNTTIFRLRKMINSVLQIENEMEKLSSARLLFKQCANSFSYAKCVQADMMLRGEFNMSMCRYDKLTGKNTGPDFMGNPNGLVTLAKCRDNADIFVLPSVAYDRGASAVRASNGHASGTKMLNEGCVAVKHFDSDVVLQHSRHLVRDVLCWESFCATPNHAIYFRDTYTSLGDICGRMVNCSWKRMEVNNLKVIMNRRYRVSEDVVITPYDVRFPWWLIWIVQIVEDMVCGLIVVIVVGGVMCVRCRRQGDLVKL